MPDIIKTDRTFIALACIDSKIRQVKHDLCDILKDWKDEKIYEYDPNEVPFELPVQSINPTIIGFTLWVPKVKQSGCVFMPNHMAGWSSITHILATKYSHQCEKIRVSTQNGEYPICEFIHVKCATERIVRSMKDDPRWEFLDRGPALEFEELENYERRYVKHRFHESLLVKYLYKLGWDLKSDSFWKTTEPYYILTKK